jgi:hypothetical protein
VLVPGGGEVADPAHRAPVERVGEVRRIEPRVRERTGMRVVDRIASDLQTKRGEENKSQRELEHGRQRRDVSAD